MDIALSETQQLLRDSIRDYLQREVPFERIRRIEREGSWDRDLWQDLQRLGWLGLPFPADLGGDDGELADFAVLLEELTRRAVLIPIMEATACGVTLARRGEGDQAKNIVRDIVAGKAIVVPAVLEANDSFENVTLQVSADGAITGEKYFVDYGQIATHHLVMALDRGERALFLVDANGPNVQAKPLPNTGRRPQALITYAGAPVVRVGGPDAAHLLVQLGMALATIQCLGASQQALDMTVEYVGSRVQFGRPIGTFQAVQHHCANMATMVEALRYFAYEAVWNLDRGMADFKQLAVAKAWASRTATEVPMMAHQLHGGIGLTEEYDLHFFSLHGKERALAWGTAEECLRIVADTLEEPEPWL